MRKRQPATKRWKQTDNSHSEYKLDIRRRFAEKVGEDTCFDLFCGTGLLTSAIWAPRMRRVICVDKSANQLEEFPERENVIVYCGNNASLLTGLLVRYGWPDVFDLDAYGYADALMAAILGSGLCDRPFAIIGTNGGMTARKRGSKTAVPIAWGFGRELSFAQYSGGMDTALVCDFTHLREWAADGGKTVAEFEGAVFGAMAYWAAIIEPAGD